MTNNKITFSIIGLIVLLVIVYFIGGYVKQKQLIGDHNSDARLYLKDFDGNYIPAKG